MRACGCCRFISLKAGLSTLCARYFLALATDFLLERLEGAFLGFVSCSHLGRLLHKPIQNLIQCLLSLTIIAEDTSRCSVLKTGSLSEHFSHL